MYIFILTHTGALYVVHQARHELVSVRTRRARHYVYTRMWRNTAMVVQYAFVYLTVFSLIGGSLTPAVDCFMTGSNFLTATGDFGTSAVKVVRVLPAADLLLMSMGGSFSVTGSAFPLLFTESLVTITPFVFWRDVIVCVGWRLSSRLPNVEPRFRFNSRSNLFLSRARGD